MKSLNNVACQGRPAQIAAEDRWRERLPVGWAGMRRRGCHDGPLWRAAAVQTRSASPERAIRTLTSCQGAVATGTSNGVLPLEQPRHTQHGCHRTLTLYSKSGMGLAFVKCGWQYLWICCFLERFSRVSGRWKMFLDKMLRRFL